MNNKNKRSLALFGAFAVLAAAFLIGCASRAPAPAVGPWGYAFTLGSFTDQRPHDDDMLMAKVPFRIDQFMNEWNGIVGQDVFFRKEAKLDVILKRYAATQAHLSYVVSMDITLRGRDEDGRVIATMDGSCSGAANPGLTQVGDFTQQVVTKGDLGALTARRRAATMWQRVLHSCVEDLAVQFGNTLAQGH